MPTSNHGFGSPLRYPGGKGMLANFMKLVLAHNNLLDGHYVEIYAGGAGIAWPLLFEEYVRHIHINDLNKSVFAFWQSVLQHTEELCQLINDTSISMEEWYRQKRIQHNPDDHSTLELGFSTFFLNRTNMSGIIQAGVIGGKKQEGEWKLDARFNKPDLIERIQHIGRYNRRISIYNQDAVDFITQVLPTLPIRSLIYLDPPYYVKGEGLYEHHYQHEHHVAISKLVAETIQQPWIVSYDDAPEIIDLYKNYSNLRYELSYSAKTRYAGAEAIFFSPNLLVPTVTHPAKVKLPHSMHPLF